MTSSHPPSLLGGQAVSPSRRLALLAALLIGGCFDESSRLPEVPVADIDVALRQALQDHHSAALAAPNSAELRGRLAMAYDVNGFEQRAIEVYGQAEALAPDRFDWPYYRAILTADTYGDYDSALASLDRAIALDDGYVPAWLYRGEWLRALGRLQEAEQAYWRAAELGAGSPAVVGRARLLFDERRFEEAVAILEPLIAVRSDPRIERMLGRAYKALGREEEARIATARGLNSTAMHWLDPRLARRRQYVAGFRNLLTSAQAMIRAGRGEDALSIAHSLLEQRPHELPAVTTLVWAYAALGRYDEAIARLRAELEASPDERSLHHMLANAYEQKGDIDAARRHLERVVELAPDNARALEELGWLKAQQGEREKAIGLLQRAIDSGAREPKQVLYRLGLLEGAAENWVAAASHFEAAAGLDAAFTLAYVQWARCLAEAGRFEAAEARLDWAERLGTHPDERASARRRLEALRRGEP